MPHASGYHDGAVTAFRVTKDSADDPWDIAIGDYGKLIFDSLNPNQIAPFDGFITPFNSGPHPVGSNNYYADTSPASDAETVYFRLEGSERCLTALMLDNKYDLSYPPIVMTQMLDADGFRGYAYQRKFTYFSYGILMGYAASYVASTKISLDLNKLNDYFVTSSLRVSGYTGYYAGPIAVVEALYSDFYTTVYNTGYTIVWPLPADDTPLPIPSDTVVPGQKFFEISSDRVAIARQGYDIDTATGEQMLISSEKGVILVVKQGIVALAAYANTTISLPADVVYDDTVFVNLITTPSGAASVYYPNLPYESSSNAVYSRAKIIANELYIENKSSIAVDVRYQLFNFGSNEGSSAPGSPTDQIFRTVEQVDGDYIQILKPGSAMPPRIDDILSDSRMSYAPIVAEGYWTVPSSTGNAGSPEAARTFEIDLTNAGGWIPMPIFTVIYGNGVIGGPKAEYMYGGSHAYNGKFNSETSYVKIEDDKITLHAYPRHPYRLDTALGAGNNPYVAPQYSSVRRVVGVRYYIFAIPLI